MRTVSRQSAKAVLLGFGAALLSAVDPLAALAAAKGHHGEASLAVLIPFWVSFAVFAVVLYKLLKKPVLNAWADRRRNTSQHIVEAERELSSASKSYEEVTRMFETLHVQVDALKNELEEETQLEVERTIANARQRAEALRNDAVRSMAAERDRAEANLRERLIEDVVTVARRKLEAALGPEVDRELRQRLLRNVEGLVQ